MHTSVSSLSSSTSFSSSSSISSSSTGQSKTRSILFLEQIKRPDKTQFSAPEFQQKLKALFTLTNSEFSDQLRVDLINNVLTQGTVKELNQLFTEMRQDGIRAYFPNIRMGKIDYCREFQEGTLSWSIHADVDDDESSSALDESREWRVEDYRLNSNSGKWRRVPTSLRLSEGEKESKGKAIQ